MTKCSPRQTPGLLERLASGPIICAEGYLFELERRGYLQAGAFVPEVVLDRPEEVKQLLWEPEAGDRLRRPGGRGNGAMPPGLSHRTSPRLYLPDQAGNL